jgi:hypothetical protein
MSAVSLARAVLDTVVGDNLVAAVLDDGDLSSP